MTSPVRLSGTETVTLWSDAIRRPSFRVWTRLRSCVPGDREGGTMANWPPASAVDRSCGVPLRSSSTTAPGAARPATTASPVGSTLTTSNTGGAGWSATVAAGGVAGTGAGSALGAGGGTGIGAAGTAGGGSTFGDKLGKPTTATSPATADGPSSSSTTFPQPANTPTPSAESFAILDHGSRCTLLFRGPIDRHLLQCNKSQ